MQISVSILVIISYLVSEPSTIVHRSETLALCSAHLHLKIHHACPSSDGLAGREEQEDIRSPSLVVYNPWTCLSQPSDRCSKTTAFSPSRTWPFDSPHTPRCLGRALLRVTTLSAFLLDSYLLVFMAIYIITVALSCIFRTGDMWSNGRQLHDKSAWIIVYINNTAETKTSERSIR